MTFQPAHKDLENPPGQIVNPIPREKTIGGIIDRVRRSEPLPKPWVTDDVLEEVLDLCLIMDGYSSAGKWDGHKEFKQKLRDYLTTASQV